MYCQSNPSQEVVGGALSRIGNYVTLDNQKQKVAVVDDVSLIFDL